MNFKEALEKDLSSVFFNVDEMADQHEFDGQTLDLIVVDNNLEDLNGLGREQLDAMQEVYKVYKTVYVKSSDFFVPKIGTELVLDGLSYYVEESGEEMGIIRIVISANES
ncbi:hypothetical protein U1P98_23185 [Lysinibacillus irui]|uniref:Uncharacterized protein n=1 Tax=Lysinibacillus irui TaxID=2998077 RepID=A0ABU5NT00_9BACI|nr:hypothetical protein [Lysinibacillus irui]MEA0556461.1 hypothetical protein [Lysinibacillus irui]MEA0979188.1 hypothetical protein [Lysinibacillus irui]MEA1045342.1 hypothetical protein [Lysinibacillus irui]